MGRSGKLQWQWKARKEKEDRLPAWQLLRQLKDTSCSRRICYTEGECRGGEQHVLHTHPAPHTHTHTFDQLSVCVLS